jgi:hypothetical protein
LSRKREHQHVGALEPSLDGRRRALVEDREHLQAGVDVAALADLDRVHGASRARAAARRIRARCGRRDDLEEAIRSAATEQERQHRDERLHLPGA